ncbi:bifunctional diguanylate cyclase/phosphodiesterase [Fundidesulfovibrio soli]|uniref:bifunctional diguanylate cyclase/phosphodiesterase n=1 Tax=Fundidesulfovibrio soli TaxID=2922716 RepID=UPI001FAF401D|nr:bifunctional diguanylate cyclase/phosphodiesterase [Fundidesulfovibrio soli]
MHQPDSDPTASLTHFKAFFAHVPIAACLMDASDTAILVNAAFERLFGFSKGEIEGRSLRGLVIPEDRSSELAALDRTVAPGRPATMETTRRRKDGRLIDVVITFFNVCETPGRECYFATYTDVSHLRVAQQNLLRAENQFQAFFENAAEGIFQTTLEGSYLVVNPALARIYGYASPGELMASLSDIRRQLYVDEGRREEFVERITRDGEIKDFESRVYRKDGSIIWISENARVVPGEDGRPAFYEGTVTDITARKQAEDMLTASRERYRSLVRSATDGILTLKDDLVSSSNIKALELFGYTRQEIGGLCVADLSPELQPDGSPSAQKARTLLDKALAGEPQRFEWVHRRKDGSEFEAEVSINRFEAMDEVFVTALVRDVSARKRTEAELQRERVHLKMLFESSPQAIVLKSPEGRILDINPAFTALFGHTKPDVRGEYNRHLIVPDELTSEAEGFHRTVVSGKTVCKETLRKTKSGVLIPVSVLGYPIMLDGAIEGIYYIYEDITERKSFEEQLTHQAFHDSLTGLPNRSLFIERLGRAMERGKRRPDYNFAVLLLDLDRFKRINDSLGHLAGDVLLKGIARRMESCLRSVDTVARLGGDEFAVLLEEFRNSREVIEVADRIREVLDRPFTISGNEVYCGASIGIVLKTKEYDTTEEILRDSDIAMYRSKESGKDRLAFTRKMREQAMEQLHMENELRHSLKNDDLALHFQPIVSTVDGSLQGFEALVRWNHPSRGMIPPDRFIPLAEETGLILPLGEWVLTQAMRQMAQWRESVTGADSIFITVNISSKQFRQPDLVEVVRRVLEAFALPPSRLRLEITESVLMEDARGAVDKLARLKSLGVRLLVDDFGTGYSSLSYLQRFPIDGLKIDRSFISGGGDRRENMEIVRTIIALARNLGLGVVAEGVETVEQLESMIELECGSAQGFLFARPMPGWEAARLIGRAFELPGHDFMGCNTSSGC